MPDAPIAINLARIFHEITNRPRGWAVDDLQQELGISRRTYRKYRKLMQDYLEALLGHRGDGAEIREVEDGDRKYLRVVYPMPDDVPVPDLYPRIMALNLAHELFGLLGETTIEEALAEEFSELRDRVKDADFVFDHLFADLDRIFFAVPDAPKDYTKHRRAIAELVKALVHRMKVRVVYRTEGIQPREYVLEPLTLAFYRGALYLFARYAGTKSPYIFFVDRIAKIEVSGERFEYPTAGEYSPTRFMRRTFGIFVGPEDEEHKVELIFANRTWLKSHLRERKWHPTQKFEDLPDGRLKMTFTVGSLVEVKRWVLGFGEDVEVKGPAELFNGEGDFSIS